MEKDIFCGCECETKFTEICQYENVLIEEKQYETIVCGENCLSKPT